MQTVLGCANTLPTANNTNIESISRRFSKWKWGPQFPVALREWRPSLLSKSLLTNPACDRHQPTLKSDFSQLFPAWSWTEATGISRNVQYLRQNFQNRWFSWDPWVSCDIWKPWIAADGWDVLLPDSVIRRTHPSNHKKAALNINISSELLSQNMTAPGSPPLTFMWSWAGKNHGFGDWKLSKVLAELSQKHPQWIMATWLKMWPRKAGSSGQKAKRNEYQLNISLYPVYILSLGSPDAPHLPR